MNAEDPSRSRDKAKAHPFRTAVIRGLGVVLPPLLTIVIFLWVGGTVEQYVLEPVTKGTRNTLVWAEWDVRRAKEFPSSEDGRIVPLLDGVVYRRVADGSYVPSLVFDLVEENLAEEDLPRTARGVYHRYVELKYLKPYVVVPSFLCIFILVLYLLGKFLAAGIGRVFWNLFERGIHRVPLVRNVYSSVKQVSDFLLNEREMEYSRVVAIEYPRKGIWSLGLVTGESMKDIEAAANEPVLSVLVCTSPMPVTGFTVTVRKSETIDLDVTLEQAFQFIFSCGVVLPPQQLRGLRVPLKAPPPLVGVEAPAHSAARDQHVVGQ